ncbi:MAG: sigma-54 dependent transcriptional regulator [Desulfobacterium sp.]|jgi:transcriptional regulator with PAS, ATPase and Fis domain|nr:sigma-54 dependent transcriptional regulator [Desulfobacterium sp.]
MNPPIIGVSRQIQKIRNLITHVADTCLNIIITGETGVGKEVVAQALFLESTRANNAFVTVNCAALPETLLESEMYGFEKGAFTGAQKKRKGKFEMAHKGVIFLDEIGDMPLALQSKILHVLQSGKFSPLGSEQDITTDAWVIAATNCNLEEKIKNKEFREDLFYRLNIIKIDIPPLRERPDDIPPLLDYYLDHYAAQYPDRPIDRPCDKTMKKLCSFQWPGNVRQLQNSIKKQMILNNWDLVIQELTQADPPVPSFESPEIANHPVASFSIISEFLDVSKSAESIFEDLSLSKVKKKAVDRVEKEIIGYVLGKTAWNRSKASKILKISYKTLLYKISDLGLVPPPKNS